MKARPVFNSQSVTIADSGSPWQMQRPTHPHQREWVSSWTQTLLMRQTPQMVLSSPPPVSGPWKMALQKMANHSPADMQKGKLFYSTLSGFIISTDLCRNQKIFISRNVHEKLLWSISGTNLMNMLFSGVGNWHYNFKSSTFMWFFFGNS